MIDRTIERTAALVRRLAQRWPRELVLRSTGEPVAILHLEDGVTGRWCLVERPTGALARVRPEELDSRPVLIPEPLLLNSALALAAVVAALAALVAH